MSDLFEELAASSGLSANEAVLVIVTNPESPFGGVVIQMPAEVPVVVDFVSVQQTFPIEGGGGTGPQGPPGPAGPAGQRGSQWLQGPGVPGAMTGLLPNDMYLNTVNGDIYQFDGSSWMRITP